MPGRFVQFMQHWNGEYHPRAVAQRRRMLDHMSPAQQRELSDMVGLARDGRERLLTLYANQFLHLLRTESRIGTTLNPGRLLDLAGTAGDGVMEGHVRFEATSIFDLAQMLAWTENQPGESRYAVGEDMACLIDFLTQSLFGKETRTSVRVFTCHNPKDHFHVQEIGVENRPRGHPTSHLLEHRLVCRTFGNGRLVFLDHRPKGLFETVIKMLKQFRDGKKGWHRISDRRGIKLIVPMVDDAHALMNALQAVMRTNGGEFIYQHSNITGNGTARMDIGNTHSSPLFRAAKCGLSYEGRVFEVLISTFEDHFSSLYATDGVNHDIYRLTQALEVYLPLLWPMSVYGIDWANKEDVQDFLVAQVRERLVWRFRPVHRA